MQRGNSDEINLSTAVLFKIADCQDKLPGQTRSERRDVKERGWLRMSGRYCGWSQMEG